MYYYVKRFEFIIIIVTERFSHGQRRSPFVRSLFAPFRTSYSAVRRRTTTTTTTEARARENKNSVLIIYTKIRI